MTLSDERLAKNEILFRAVNERLDELGEAAPWSKKTDYLCECSDTSCIEIVELTQDEYERVRSRPTVFVVVPGHQRPEIEKVIEENEGFLLVEKVVAVEEVIEGGPPLERARLGLMRALFRAVLAFVALGTLYLRFLRTPVLTWGATDAGGGCATPGRRAARGCRRRRDAGDRDRRAPAAVWPWIAQMGPSPRGGAYTYDWIENLVGLNMHSADRVLPEFQHPEVGETIGYGSNRMRVERVEPEHVLAWRSEDGNWVWTFVLEERGGSTRLISRNRFRLPTLAARIGMIPMEPASLLMERKMLTGSRSGPRSSARRRCRCRSRP